MVWDGSWTGIKLGDAPDKVSAINKMVNGLLKKFHVRFCH